ncbi:transcription termination/antitermination protein NusA [Flammeovirga sp. MY04]|nr:transcription termination/antitermination protein NusA [Flammeovirga sp. MY04]
MNSSELIESFKEFAKMKGIDRPTMIKILEDVFKTMIRKQYGDDATFDVIINVDAGDLEIWRYRQIVADDAEDFDAQTQIHLTDAKKIEEDFEVDEEVAEAVEIDFFGRRMVQTARQTLIQKVKDLEKKVLFDQYKERVGELIMGEVYQTLHREFIIIDQDNNELSLPRNEMIPKDRYRKGDHIRAVIDRVEMNNNNPKIVLSRTSPLFLRLLFENEVPEIFDGLIAIRNIVREPGERAKVSVESFDERVDPVGACVGMRGSRIHSIVRELQNENIDVINYTENMDLMIRRALSPAHIAHISINDEEKRVEVTLPQDQVSLAIGKNGQNIKLASKLVGYEIDVFREMVGEQDDDMDYDVMEFNDMFEDWMLQEFKRIGLDTAGAVLDHNVQELERRTELEEETIIAIMEVMRRQFEEDKKSSAQPNRPQPQAANDTVEEDDMDDLVDYSDDIEEYNETETSVSEDVDLSSFNNVIEEWIIDEFKKAKLGTVNSILSISREEVIERTDLEDETVDEVLTAIKQ